MPSQTRRAYRLPLPPPRCCPACDLLFQPMQRNTEYCSNACKQAAYRLRRRRRQQRQGQRPAGNRPPARAKGAGRVPPAIKRKKTIASRKRKGGARGGS